jgi:hypothetical protein
VDYKHTRIKQYHKQGRALRTETTINNTRDFGIGKRLTNLPALREIGFSANRRLLHVQRLGHDPITGTDALHAITAPVTTTGARVPVDIPKTVEACTMRSSHARNAQEV